MSLMFFQSLRFVKAAKPSAYYLKISIAAFMSLMFLLSKNLILSLMSLMSLFI